MESQTNGLVLKDFLLLKANEYMSNARDNMLSCSCMISWCNDKSCQKIFTLIFMKFEGLVGIGLIKMHETFIFKILTRTLLFLLFTHETGIVTSEWTID